jgi:PAS domain S-box-containing protein
MSDLDPSQEKGRVRITSSRILERNAVESLSPEKTRDLIHDLHTHQIELEMQNEELRQAQADLAEVRDRYTDLYDFAPVGYLTSDRKGRVVEANLTLATMLGMNRGKLIGQPLVAFAAGAESADVLRKYLASLLVSRVRESCEVVLKSADSGSFWAKLESEVNENAETGELQIRFAISDISEKRQAQEARFEMERKMFQAQKLESLGVLAGGIAHDFNNLLTGILGNADLALTQITDHSPVYENLIDIDKASRRAADLCKQMLDYSGKGNLKLRPIDCSILVEEMTRLMDSSISKKVALVFELEEKLPAVNADPTQIRQIVMNLITNASEAIGESEGTITVSTHLIKNAAMAINGDVVAADERPAGDCVCVAVRDTGCGMDAHTRGKIFDPFYTTKFTGRGLGLASLLGIVRSHRGAVAVRSAPGEGTLFRVFLPATDQPAKVAGSLPSGEIKRLIIGTVLVIDDESHILSLTRRIFQLAGCEVLTASDGEEGIAVFREHQTEIVAVLLDLTMPRLRGEIVSSRLLEIRDDLPVAISSGYSQDEVSSLFEGRKPAAFIQKPYSSVELVNAISHIVGSG